MNKPSVFLAALLVSLVAWEASGTLETNVLIGLGSNWKYYDRGTDQGTAWRAPLFDDSGWSNGVAQLGYGDGDEVTVVSYGTNAANKYITTYFRRTFPVVSTSNYLALTMRLIRDDGVIVYL